MWDDGDNESIYAGRDVGKQVWVEVRDMGLWI